MIGSLLSQLTPALFSSEKPCRCQVAISLVGTTTVAGEDFKGLHVRDVVECGVNNYI